MKRILLSVLTIGLVASVAFGVTQAYFFDVESSVGNTFTAGQLDLELGNPATLPFDVSDLYPGQTGTGKVTLTNVTGSLDGDLDVNIENFVQAENGLIEPELEAGDYDNGGDLDLSFVIADMFVDVNQDGTFNTGDIQLAYNGQKKVYPGFWIPYHPSSVSSMLPGWDDIMTMTAGQSVDLVIMWQLPTTWTYPKYNQNIVQTDSLGFDVFISLEQVGGSGGVTE